MKWSDFDRWLKAEHLQGKARVLTIDQVVIEEVYSQAEKRNRPAPVLYFRETKKGLVLSGPNQDALQALFGDDVSACFGAKVLLEPTPMRVAGRELVVIRLKAAPGGNGTAQSNPPRHRVRRRKPASPRRRTVRMAASRPRRDRGAWRGCAPPLYAVRRGTPCSVTLATSRTSVAWDNSSTHQNNEIEAVVRGGADHLMMLYLLTYGPWLNPSEMFWRDFRRNVTHCELFENLKALVAATLDYFRRCNTQPARALSIIGSHAA
jgi:putative transposase